MSLELTEEEKNKIKELHGITIIKEQELSRGENLNIINGCITKTAVANLGEVLMIPLECTQFMLANSPILNVPTEEKNAYGNSCMRMLADILLGDDNEKAKKLLKMITQDAIEVRDCISGLGGDISKEIIRNLG